MANEKRLIDAMQTTIKLSGRITPLIKMGENPMRVYQDVLNVIEESPTVDAVSVVRYEYCKKGHPELCMSGCVWCFRYRRYMNTYDFCSYGERKEGDD